MLRACAATSSTPGQLIHGDRQPDDLAVVSRYLASVARARPAPAWARQQHTAGAGGSSWDDDDEWLALAAEHGKATR